VKTRFWSRLTELLNSLARQPFLFNGPPWPWAIETSPQLRQTQTPCDGQHRAGLPTLYLGSRCFTPPVSPRRRRLTSH
jgi:hypothetical protein